MTKGLYYQRVMPIVAILYVIVMALTGWNGTIVVVGALVVALFGVIGNWFASDTPRT